MSFRGAPAIGPAIDVAFDLVVAAEGTEYIDDADDPGGPTKLGVSWRAVHLRDVDRDGQLDFDLDGDGDVDAADIRLVTTEHAQRLFREDYWSTARCSSLPWLIAIAVADSAYNQGPRTAIALLQRALGRGAAGRADGIVGPKTLAAVWRRDSIDVLTHYAGHRADRYRIHPQAPKFFRGWHNRLVELDRALMARAAHEAAIPEVSR